MRAARTGKEKPAIVLGVMGSAKGADKAVFGKARALGAAVARAGCVLLTGATVGLPDQAVQGCNEEGGLSIGFSPAQDKKEHLEKYGYPLTSRVVLYSGLGLTGRNVLNIRACHGVLFVGGSVGTLNEFTVAYATGKAIGVLEGSGGISQRFKDITAWLGERDTGARLFHDSDPDALVHKVLAEVRKREHA